MQVISKSIGDLQSYRSLNIQNIARARQFQAVVIQRAQGETTSFWAAENQGFSLSRFCTPDP